MFYLLLAVCSSVTVSLVMRWSAKKAPGSLVMLATNYFMCLVIASAFSGFGALAPRHPALPATLGYGLINGVLYLTSFIIYQRSVRRNGIVLSSTFMKLGLLVPIAISVLIFREMPSGLQAAGFVLAIVAIILINAGGTEQSGKFSAGLLLLLFTGGGANAMSEIYEQIGEPSLSSQFLLYTFAAAFVLCVLLALFKKEQLTRHAIFYGLLIGIPNYFSARFLLLSLQTVPAAIAHPTYSALSVCLVSVLGVCAFKERLTRRQWLAMGIILVCLVLLNL